MRTGEGLTLGRLPLMSFRLGTSPNWFKEPQFCHVDTFFYGITRKKLSSCGQHFNLGEYGFSLFSSIFRFSSYICAYWVSIWANKDLLCQWPVARCYTSTNCFRWSMIFILFSLSVA
ncbi:cyclin-dependent kinase B1-1 [Iris pallida]|uniref:Cyclin-dependent kinase B1-1 n=1 Tax=Iris pallida TaxID=29817 RepID=A0AAX6IJ57_IRIPA|nr:cyclin-dependent kinase B1-1 [Iris pallida]